MAGYTFAPELAAVLAAEPGEGLGAETFPPASPAALALALALALVKAIAVVVTGSAESAGNGAPGPAAAVSAAALVPAAGVPAIRASTAPAPTSTATPASAMSATRAVRLLARSFVQSWTMPSRAFVSSARSGAVAMLARTLATIGSTLFVPVVRTAEIDASEPSSRCTLASCEKVPADP